MIPRRVISAAELHARLQKGEAVTILDVELEDVFRRRHLPGALNACVFKVSFADDVRALGIDPGADLVVCGGEADSREALDAMDKLDRMGFSSVSGLRGGVEAWRQDGLPLEGETPAVEPPREADAGCARRTYVLDPAQSQLRWQGRNANVTHQGGLSFASGSLELVGDELKGEVVVDMKSVVNFNLDDSLKSVLVHHLMSDDFFFAARFPTARLTVTNGVRVRDAAPGQANYEVQAELAIKDVAAPLAFRTTVAPAVLENGRQGVCLEAHFDFDRTHWNVLYGSGRFYTRLGMHLVYDPISIEARIVAY